MVKNKRLRIWVIGAGKFGRISVEALMKGHGKTEITVVDSEARCLDQISDLPVVPVLADGIAFLDQNLVSDRTPDWIIPVIPLHVAAEWVCARLGISFHARLLPVPDAVANRLPNPMRGPKGEVYLSLADFVCPEDCPQPIARCTHTGISRPYNLYDHLAAVQHKGHRSIVVISRQLAPGVGGLAPQDLLQTLAAATAECSPFLLSTACRCHGVLSVVGVEPKGTRSFPFDKKFQAGL